MNPTTELQERFSEIIHVITCLYRFSITTRNPVQRDRLQKCASIDVSHYEFFDIQHASNKFPNAEEYLIDRLGKANSTRRQLLKYHEKHHKKLARRIDLPLGSALAVLQLNQYEAVNDGGELLARTGDQGLQSRHSNSTKAPSTIATTINTQTTVSTHVGGLSNTIEVDSDTDRSQTSYATSVNGGDKGRNIRIPPPKFDSNFDGNPFECPYCFSIMTAHGSQFWM